MHSNAPRSQMATEGDLVAWSRRVLVPELEDASVRYRAISQTSGSCGGGGDGIKACTATGLFTPVVQEAGELA